MLNSAPFQRGDIVQTNSGDQRMVVESIENDAGNIVVCKWYEGRVMRKDRFFTGGLHHFQMAASGSEKAEIDNEGPASAAPAKR